MHRKLLALALVALACPAAAQELGLPLPRPCVEVSGRARVDPEGRLRLGECRLPSGEVWRLTLRNAPEWLVELVRGGSLWVAVSGELAPGSAELVVRRVIEPAPPVEMEHEVRLVHGRPYVFDEGGRSSPVVGPAAGALGPLLQQEGLPPSRRVRLLATWAPDGLAVVGVGVNVASPVRASPAGRVAAGAYWVRGQERSNERSLVELSGEKGVAWVEIAAVRLDDARARGCERGAGVIQRPGVCELVEQAQR